MISSALMLLEWGVGSKNLGPLALVGKGLARIGGGMTVPAGISLGGALLAPGREALAGSGFDGTFGH
jgi:hypothetical protein